MSLMIEKCRCRNSKFEEVIKAYAYLYMNDNFCLDFCLLYIFINSDERAVYY